MAHDHIDLALTLGLGAILIFLVILRAATL